jgi:putative DNA primase/helicase
VSQADDRLSIDQFLALLQSVTRVGDNWQAMCPSHEDRRASLSVGVGEDGRILVNCHAGCTFDGILAALNLSASALFPQGTAPGVFRPGGQFIVVKAYDYRDLHGVLQYQVCRLDPKTFRQRRPDPAGKDYIWDMKGVARLPYRLNDIKGHASVYVVEGEKDADALWARKLPATTNVGGAGKWKDSDSDWLRTAGVTRIVILPDNDSPGRKHATSVAESAKAAGLGVTIIELPNVPPKGDVSDWFALGYTTEALEQKVASALWIVPNVLRPEVEIEECAPEDHPLRWKQTDWGAAEAFAHRNRDRIRYDHRQAQWLVWDQHYWKPDATHEVYRLATDHARIWQEEAARYIKDTDTRRELLSFALKLERRSGVENTLHLANAVLPLADNGENWNVQPMLLGCPNGVVDLATGQLRDGRPTDRITIQTGVPFLNHEACPRWLQFLEQIFDGDADVITFVHRALGYSLTADMREQCFFMCVGSGSNGKSTFLSTLDYVWGRHCYTTAMQTFTNQPGGEEDRKFDLAELHARRLVIAAETKANSQFNETVLKNFTGGEKINAQRKYGHPFEYVPTAKIWLGVNHQPRVKDDSFGFWRRVRLIPFRKIFQGSNDDRSLKDILRSEGAGILAWAVRGALDWKEKGLLPPADVMSATDAYQESENPLHDFILERVSMSADASVSVPLSYVIYNEWATSQGYSERERLTSHNFSRLMSRRFEIVRKDGGRRFMGIHISRDHKDLLSQAE